MSLMTRDNHETHDPSVREDADTSPAKLGRRDEKGGALPAMRLMTPPPRKTGHLPSEAGEESKSVVRELQSRPDDR